MDRTVFALTMFCLFAFEGKVRCHKQTVYFGRRRRHRPQEALVAMADFGSDAVDLIDGFVFTEQNFERQNAVWWSFGGRRCHRIVSSRPDTLRLIFQTHISPPAPP